MRLVLLGPPGAGKGTQARALSARYGVPQISSGDLLRAAAQGNSQTGRQAHELMERGQLVPDAIVVDLIKEWLSAHEAGGGFILDGFPRSVAQAESLAAILRAAGGGLDRAVALIVPDEELVKRISGRRTCRNCGAMYHVNFKPPKVADACDKCGGPLYRREDDSEATERERLKVYAKTTFPLLDYYEQRGLLTKIDGIGGVKGIEQRIIAALGGYKPKASPTMRAQAR
ncbi:MAG: adenylate kinase [Candidatus Binataceae bacterium]